MTLSVCCTPDLMAAAAVLLHTVSDPMIPSAHKSMKSLCTMSDASAFCYAANRAAGNKHDMHSDQKEQRRRRSASAQHAKKSVRISQIVRKLASLTSGAKKTEQTESGTCELCAGVSRMSHMQIPDSITSDQRTDCRSGRRDSFL